MILYNQVNRAGEELYVHGVAVAGGERKASARDADVDDDGGEHGVPGGHGEVEGDEEAEGGHACENRDTDTAKVWWKLVYTVQADVRRE